MQFFWDKKNEKETLIHVIRVIDNEYYTNYLKEEIPFSSSFQRINKAIGGLCVAAQRHRQNSLLENWLQKDLYKNVFTQFQQRKKLKIREDSWQVYRDGGNLFLLEKKSQNQKSNTEVFRVIIDGKKIVLQSKQYDQIFYFYMLLNTIILTSIGFFRLAKYLFKPLDNLKETADRYLKSGELVSPVFVEKKGFRQIQYALNCMVDRINADQDELKRNIASLELANKTISESQKSLVQSEKLAAVGRLSAGIAHEIGNPLGIIQGYVELLESEDLAENERKQYVNRAKKELDRISKMIRQLLDYARKPATNDATTQVTQLVEEIKTAFLTRKKKGEIDLVINIGDNIEEIRINHDDIYQVILNCLFNAIDAIESEDTDSLGIIQFTVQKMTEENVVVLSMTDNGAGIPEESLNSVWDPFYTTKDVGAGTGLGLFISHAIIEQAGGTIEISSSCEQGTEIKITLPA